MFAGLGALVVPASDGSGCGIMGEWTNGCSTGTAAGDHVDVTAHEGTGAHSHSTGSDDIATGDSDDDAPYRPPHDPYANVCDEPALCPAAIPQADDPTPGPTPAPGVSMSDLTSFYPSKPRASSEPDGWTVVGLDTNFMTDATVHTATGRLLNQQASVRFTPVGFVWDYGDGQRATTRTAGASWASLRVAEFSPTPTSHAYAATGTYDVQVIVVYTARYRLGSGAWRDVTGTLSLSAPTLKVIASDATTVLVRRDCAADPRGPGC
ncbi:hypothetical protein [Humibacter ginsenosidimutans]|nr:hypothetical protein [Humibacter ginsenosidimutans]